MSAALAIHPGALGDVLLAVPALRALGAGGDALTVAAQPRIGALLVALGVVDRAVAFDTLGLEALFTDAPLAADAPLAGHLGKVTRVVCWFGARDPQFARRLRALAPGVMIAPATTSTTPVWEHLVRTVGGTADRTPITVAPALMEDGQKTLRAAGWDGHSRLLLVHPGAGGAAKRWPADGFADVVATVDATVVVHEGPADAVASRAFAEQLGRRAVGPVLCVVEPALPLLAGVLASTAAYLGNDSGVSHLAASVGTPSVVLFTEAALAWVPWSHTAHCLTITTSRVVDTERAAVESALRALL